jgi:hypothetical protein
MLARVQPGLGRAELVALRRQIRLRATRSVTVCVCDARVVKSAKRFAPVTLRVTLVTAA